MRKAPPAIGSLLMVLVLLAGCASIPRTSGVNQAPGTRADQPAPLDLLVDGPDAGASQQQILNGFLDAVANPRNGYQIARQFLTESFAAEWNPDAAALVYEDREPIQTVSETSLSISVVPAADLAANGTYQLSRSDAVVPLTYTFEQVGGEWRIATAPTGLVIDDALFRTVFGSYTLWFYDPSFRFLVPDVRWFAGRESAQTSVVRALLAGAAEWLRPGVVSAFPEDVQLELDSVPVSAGTARVALTGTLPDDRLTRQRMQAQIQATLENVRSVTDVDLVLNGISEDGPPLAAPPITEPRVEREPVVFDGATLGYLDLLSSGTEVRPIAGVSEQVALLQPTGAAVGVGADAIAVQSTAGVSLVRRGEETLLLDPRVGLAVPTIDGYDVVWSVPIEAPDELTWRIADGANGQVRVPWTGQRVVAIEMSRDSTRLAALLDDGQASLSITSVLRDADGLPTELAATALPLASLPGEPLDVAWLDARTVAILVGTDDGGTTIVEQVVGGFAREDPGPDGAVEIDGANAARDIRVLTGDGEYQLRAGVGWQARAVGVDFLASQMPQ